MGARGGMLHGAVAVGSSRNLADATRRAAGIERLIDGRVTEGAVKKSCRYRRLASR